MRSYIDLANFYPANSTLVDIDLDRNSGSSKILAAPDIITHYGQGSFENTFTYQYNLKKNTGFETILMMDSGPFELVTNKFFIDNAFGDVLIFGLGLGMIIYPLLLDETVTSITVVEIDPNVIALIKPYILANDIYRKVIINEGDVYTYESFMDPRVNVYDFIYFDYWDRISPRTAGEMEYIKNLYLRFLKSRDSIIYCWCEDILFLLPEDE